MKRRVKQSFSSLAASLVVSAGMTCVDATAGDDRAGIGAAKFNGKGELLQPEGFREWIFIGAPLTPNGLNNGAAGFPEFHHVYVNPDAYAIYKRSGVFPDGTVIAKELLLLHKGDHQDGSKVSPSGRGYFAKTFNGLDVMVKDNKRFKSTNGWGFFNFGHKAEPYAASAPPATAADCAGCHQGNAGEGMVFKEFYPLLGR